MRGALESLEAESTFYPSLELQYLERGHACHFICRAHRASGFRVDVMSKLRGCPDFRSMYSEREMHRVGALEIPVIGVKHLVAAKKTQRDKDWPMVRRLVEEHYRRRGNEADWAQWWLRESRTPALLVELAARFPEEAASLMAQRPLLSGAIERNTDAIEEALLQEELAERRADRAYWEPLRRELEQMRHARR